MIERIIIAGFGGQGVMSIGQMLAYAGMLEDKGVSWLPSYGPEMRGGTANCHVIVTEGDVDSPLVSKASTALVLNRPSFFKFEPKVVKDGLLIVNSSLVEDKSERDDIRAYYVPAGDLALEVGNDKATNMVMLGAYIQLTGIVECENIRHALEMVFGKRKSHIIDVNYKALKAGADYVKNI